MTVAATASQIHLGFKNIMLQQQTQVSTLVFAAVFYFKTNFFSAPFPRTAIRPSFSMAL